MLTGGFIVAYLISKIETYQLLKNDIAETIIGLDRAQKTEKDFLLFGWKQTDFLENGNNEFTDNYFQQIREVSDQLNKKLNDVIVGEANLKTDIQSILLSISLYENSFEDLRKILQYRGFRNHGMEVKMRDYAHDLQESRTPEEQVYAYKLRRHEKDFMLRKDLGYHKKFNAVTDEFKAYVQTLSENLFFEPAYIQNQYNLIDSYQEDFNKIVNTEIIIGLDEKSGIMKELNENKSATIPRINSLYTKINDLSEKLRQDAQIVISLTIILLLFSVFLLVFYLRKTVSKPIIKLDDLVKKVLSGDSNAGKELDYESKDEIGSLNRNFKLMLDNLRENLKLIRDKNESLELKAKQDEIRSWNIEGLSHFSDLMKGNNSNVSDFAHTIISETVKYLKANQGVFFILNEENDEQFMELKACYAFNKKKYIHKKIEKGEGLVGQTWLEGEAIYMTEVPKTYINITSGLGDAPPKSIMIMPLKTDQQIVGIIEIASFQEFKLHEQEFLVELTNRLGSVIQSIKMQEKTQKLLEHSQEMTEQLQAQEEEMRQNMEELQATQEEMSRNQKSLNESISLKDFQLKMMNSLLGKVYEGILFINKDYQIAASNNYIVEELRYNENDLIGNNPELIFKTPLKKKIEALQNDPKFILTGISERQEAQIIDKFNNVFDTRFVMTKIEQNEEQFYAVLFNKKESEYDKRVLKHLFQAR